MERLTIRAEYNSPDSNQTRMSNVTPLMGELENPREEVRKMPAKKVSRVIDVQKNNQLKYNFTGVPETDRGPASIELPGARL